MLLNIVLSLVAIIVTVYVLMLVVIFGVMVASGISKDPVRRIALRSFVASWRVLTPVKKVINIYKLRMVYAILNQPCRGWKTNHPDMVCQMVHHALNDMLIKDEIILGDYQIFDIVSGLVKSGATPQFTRIQGICMDNDNREICYYPDAITEELLRLRKKVSYDVVRLYVTFIMTHERRHRTQAIDRIEQNQSILAIGFINGTNTSSLAERAYNYQLHEIDADKSALLVMKHLQLQMEENYLADRKAKRTLRRIGRLKLRTA